MHLYMLYFTTLIPGIAAHPSFVTVVFAVGTPAVFLGGLIAATIIILGPVCIDRTRIFMSRNDPPPLIQIDQASEEEDVESSDQNAVAATDTPPEPTSTPTNPLQIPHDIPFSIILQRTTALIPQPSSQLAIPNSPSTASRISSHPPNTTEASDASSQTSIDNDDARTNIGSKEDIEGDVSHKDLQEFHLRETRGSSVDIDYYEASKSLPQESSDSIEAPRRNRSDTDSIASKSSDESPTGSIKRTTGYSPSVSPSSSYEENQKRIRESNEQCGTM